MPARLAILVARSGRKFRLFSTTVQRFGFLIAVYEFFTHFFLSTCIYFEIMCFSSDSGHFGHFGHLSKSFLQRKKRLNNNIYYYCLKTLSPKVILTKMTLTILTKMTTILVS